MRSADKKKSISRKTVGLADRPPAKGTVRHRRTLRKPAFDPIALEIHWKRLVSMVDEASTAFIRTSFSVLVREANDFAVVLTDAQGRSLAQSTMSIASFIGSLPATVKHFLDVFPAHTLKPGDVMITNDPWMGTGHIHDVNIAMPIFHRGKLVAFAAVVSHMPDIGGRLRNAGVREIYEEGLQIPRLKLIDGGKPNQTLFDMIAQNVRVPEMTLGDIWAQVAACKMLEERLQPLLRDVDLNGLGDEIRTRSEAAMRKAIRAVPDGTYHSRLEHDGFEEPIVINCTVKVKGDTIAIDYTGSSDQVPRAVNVVPIYCFAYSAYAVKALLSPDVPNNEGSFLPITTSAPLGSIFNPRFPAASGGRGMIGHMMVPAIIMALAQALPERAIAEGSSNSSITVAGEHDGRPFSSICFMNGGQGATQHRDGYSVLSFPSNLGNTPIEVFEQQAPLRVVERSIRRDSGGDGAHRGGGGLHFEIEVTGDKPLLASMIMTRFRSPPKGLLGGAPGKVGTLELNGTPIDPADHWVLKKGDRVVMQTAGGGGFGAA
ncbi:MAG TPA: hydantoinase B/oxoprolinase family protein [Burkholderiales bacterium]|nr:hydantoinase B/oxoprolinase family protein [Burkholderiales bacterium]